MLKKFNTYMMASSLLMLSTFLAMESAKKIELKTFSTMKEVLMSFNLSVQLEYKSKMFIGMVILVTTVVSIYSEMYMEHYNNKKFFILLFAFFTSMVLLSSSSSMMNLMMGWEMLGLTSLCLIMFYPSKTSKMNSIMTMLFNRMGDILMIMILGTILMEMTNSFSMMKLNKEMMLLFLVCSLTKSAQFPMSAWLPAAMAAPTPISAMVHSSTLVTAGIFLMVKLHENILMQNMMEILICLSMISFFMGGWMSNMELDYKKMIAFSTMSQISMIMLFSTSKMMQCSLTHMMYHAFFKTLLFCTAGFIFMMHWSEQMKNKMKLKSTNKVVKFLLFVSIYCMTGLLFSASYYTKDLYLEVMLFSSKNYLLMMFSIAASLMTMFYSIKMMKPLKNMEKAKNFYMKIAKSLSIMIMSGITLTSEILMKALMFKEWSPQMKKEEVLMMVVILMIWPILSKNFFKMTKFLMSLNLEISYMKFQMYSGWKIFLNSKKMDLIFESDLMFMKKSYMLGKNFVTIEKSNYPIMILMTFMMVLGMKFLKM